VRQVHAFGDMHVSETVVHHISEEDDCVWSFTLRDAPHLAQIRIDEDPGHGPKERTALQVRPLVENLWIGDEEDVSRRFSISLMSTQVSQAAWAVERRWDAYYSWIWPSTAYTRSEKDTDFEP
jgi:hypothetical protein